jgi:hypothetical protein
MLECRELHYVGRDPIYDREKQELGVEAARENPDGGLRANRVEHPSAGDSALGQAVRRPSGRCNRSAGTISGYSLVSEPGLAPWTQARNRVTMRA